MFLLNGSGTNISYAENGALCTAFDSPGHNHEMVTKEHASGAANEGFAHYYAAVTFNKTNQTNCAFMYRYDQDFDLDGTVDFAGIETMNCEGSPIWSMTSVGAKDYLDEFCDGPLEDRGTELDWLRFFWDLDTEHLTHVELMDFVDGLNAHSWNAVGVSGTADPDDVWERVKASAQNPLIDVWAAVQAEQDNGIDH